MMDPIRVRLRTSSGAQAEAQILCGIPTSGREEILRLWRPFIQLCREDDAKWAWRWILAPIDGMIELALVREGRTEG
jgi:lipid A disaccharide synthetase